MTEKKTKRARVNMRIPPDLLQWAKEHAARRNTTVTQLFIDYLTKEMEENRVH